ncbi:signal transduction histidine kinase [Tumebacillus sp. BK434]|uniref:sensor histidine kinase n=1 Tax=Tumebacillus sp. BK434 TaxID=2512169 RepID=UPI0010524C51|nr:HAMP domain-containing sensor histidine kinase [Tumebacillus sp. BK434]TCP57934.1 signal transduction histidine kinase [Tumebacillus sp. BK434]
MKSLYVRIVLMTVVIVMVSALFGFWLSNLYYQLHMKGYNEQKIYEIASETAALYERNPEQDLEAYLTSIAKLNYQLYVVDEQMQVRTYGDAFRETTLPAEMIRQVQAGEAYRGAEHTGSLFVTGFFENTLQNSVGVPLRANGETYAVFLRPNIERMFGEVRVLFARLLLFTFLFSLVLILACTRYLVKPLELLTAATKRIAEGDFAPELDVKRQDEIGRLARDFSRMAESLRKLDRTRQEFVANVSHEIQSPLTSIQGFSQALRTERMSEEEREAYLAIIETESRRLSSLSQQLLTLASLDHAEEAREASSFRLDEQIRDVVRSLQWQWSEGALSIDLQLLPVTVSGQPHFLHLVWVNLLANSIKFTEPGGAIRITMQRGPREVTVEIADTGIGIAADDLQNVFERFYKADKARQRQRAGSGLGLAIVLKVVQMHGGTVEAASEPGAGTTFRVRLPHL